MQVWKQSAVSDSRVNKGSAPQQRRLLFAVDVMAWSALPFWCTAILMLAFGPWNPGHRAWGKFWGFGILFDVLPFVAGMSWLLVKTARRLAHEGTDLNNWSENFPSRIWPVLLPLLLLVGSAFVAFVMILIRQIGK
jgi:heme/copper-type cytochrome/quinol oxidase subunit 2